MLCFQANNSNNDSGMASMNQMSSPGRHSKSGAAVSFSKTAGSESLPGATIRGGGARALLSDLR